MNLSRIIFVFLLLATGFYQANAQSNIEQEVKKTERAWLDAYEQRDAKAMNEIVAEDFTITFPDGSTRIKQDVVNSIKAQANSKNSPPKYETEDVQTRIYDNTVILSGIVISQWTQNGEKKESRSRYTDVYVRRNGRWQVVASHLSNAPAQSK